MSEILSVVALVIIGVVMVRDVRDLHRAEAQVKILRSFLDDADESLAATEKVLDELSQ